MPYVTILAGHYRRFKAIQKQNRYSFLMCKIKGCMVCQTQIPFKPNDIYFRLCYDFLKIAYLQKNKFHKRERNTWKVGKQVFFWPVCRRRSMGNSTRPNICNGPYTKIFLFKVNKKAFPLLSLPCAAADLFSTVIIY